MNVNRNGSDQSQGLPGEPVITSKIQTKAQNSGAVLPK